MSRKKKRARRLEVRGYEMIGRRLVHRLVWAAAYGEPPAGWVVHHVNCDKLDNRLENLVALPWEYHDIVHDRIDTERRTVSREELMRVYDDHLRQSPPRDPEEVEGERATAQRILASRRPAKQFKPETVLIKRESCHHPAFC